NYGYFGDELYFIDCARHLAWGYVDQPPLIPLIAWMTTPIGYALWALRLLPVLTAGATVIVSTMVAKAFGGGRYAQLLTALAVALAPINLLLGSILSTSAFEPFLWTLLLYLIVRIVNGADSRLFVLIGGVVAIGLYAKFSIAFCALAVLLGIAVTQFFLPQKRQTLASPWVAIAIVGCAALVMPVVAWQWQHHWPMLDVLHQDALNRHALGNGVAFESSNVAINALFFLASQALYCNPLLTIVWVWGVFWLGFSRSATPYRFLAIAYVLLFGLMVALTARGYYLAGFYPTLFAAGGVAIEGTLRLRIHDPMRRKRTQTTIV